MIPAKLTGKPFWDLYLYNDPPIWEAYIACAKHFNIDSLMDGYFPMRLPDPAADAELASWQRFIVERSPERIVTQSARKRANGWEWRPTVEVYYVADSPTCGVNPAKIGLPAVPTTFTPLEGVKPVDLGATGLTRVKKLMGDQGLVGVWCGAGTCALGNEEMVYEYYDHPELHEQWRRERLERVETHMARILALEDKPDFICVGGSGSLIWQTPEVFREFALPAVKRAIDLATAAGLPTQVHSCGPETELVRILAEETNLTVIDPLEIPPMGDCILADLKRRYGHKLVLKGNLHTTEVMLRGKPDDVRRAARQAIDDGAAGGRFILSTGDQCGRDTPHENLYAMVETARTYGRYPLQH
jgi:uroporphyrinogen decarboxylase